MNPKDKLVKAKVQVLLRSPFMSYKLLKTPCVLDPGVEKVATDGKTIRFNPEYVEKLTIQELTGEMAKASGKILFGHHLRRGAREQERWDKASDFAIDPLVEEAGFTLPPDSPVNQGYAHKAAEEIYKLLPTQPKNGNGKGKGKGGGGSGQGKPQPGDGENEGGGSGSNVELEQPKSEHRKNNDGSSQSMNKTELEQAESELKKELAGALHAAKMQGKMPLGLERLIGDLLEPKVNWRAELAQYLKDVSNRADYSFSKPNMRYAHTGFILPSLKVDKGGDIGEIIDTSGSISQEDLNLAGGEVVGISTELHVGHHVVYVDTQVYNPQYFEPDETPTFKADGGGGSNMTPGFKWMLKNAPDVLAILCFTDGYIDYPKEDPGIPVLWILNCRNDGFSPTYGKIIHVEKD